MNFLKKLYVQVFIGLILGIVLGYFAPEFAVQTKPLADIFIRLIKLLITPIIFLTIVTGIASMQDARQVGRLGGAALLFFLIITTLALVLGIGAAAWFKPGAGMNIDAHGLSMEAVNSMTGGAQKVTSLGTLLTNAIPRTFFSAFVEGDILQVLLVAIFFAFALLHSGIHAEPILLQFRRLSQVFFRMIHLVMYLAPMGTFAAMAYSVGEYGISPLLHLAGLISCYYLTSLFFIVVILGSILQGYCKISIWQLLRYLKPELLIVWGTASSETVLPSLMEKLEAMGCKPSTVGLVLPMGYSFNLAGTAIYLTLAAMFIAQATNTSLTWAQELSLLGLMVISSKGAAGVSGSGFIVLTSSLAAFGLIPVSGVVLILGIDKFMNEGRAIINMIGNTIATLLISHWQGSLDLTKLQTELAEPQPSPTQTAVEL